MKKMFKQIVVAIFVVAIPAISFAVPATFISPSQITSTPFSITSPGLYVLTDDVAYNTSGGTAITINSSDVTLDLNGKAIINSGAGVENAISLASTFTNITIRNGALRIFDGSGVSIPTGSADLVFENVIVIGVNTIATTGIAFNFAGVSGATTRTSGVVLKCCEVTNCFRAINATAVDGVMLRDSVFSRNGNRGISVTNCNRWDFDHCQVSFNSSTAGGEGVVASLCDCWTVKNSDFSGNTAGSGQGSGMVFQVNSLGAGGHIIENCTFNGNSSDSTAIGLNLGATNSCIIKNCLCNGNFSTGITNAAGSGMVVSGTSILIDNCKANGNYVLAGTGEANGLDINSASTGVNVTNCEFSGNAAFGTGAGIGLNVDGGLSHVVVNCITLGNASSGSAGRGILLRSAASKCIVKNCTAVGNTSNGFTDSAAAGANLFIGNVSFGHGVAGINNYSGAVPFLSVAASGPYPVGPTFDERDLANLSFT